MVPIRTAVAILIPEPIAGRLTELQHTYDLPPWEPRIPLHITLVTPFTTQETIEMLTKRIAPVVTHRAPFVIELGDLSRFDNEESVIFSSVTSTDMLTTLADTVLATVLDLHLPRSRPFIPHVTIANKAPREIVNGYFERLANIHVNERFFCDRFALLHLDEQNQQWYVTQEFPFT